MTRFGHEWAPLLGLGDDVRAHHAPSVVGLAHAWTEERQAMQALDVEGRFLERWKNRLAVETGVLEGLYALDRGVTETLIERGFDAALIPQDATDHDPQLVVNLLRDQREAVDLVFDVVADRRTMDLSFVKELHSLLTYSQRTTTAVDQFGRTVEVDLLRGAWKQLPNNPTRRDGIVHEYCPPEQVQPEMERLVDLTEQYCADEVSPDVVAAWCHHRFTQVHPFQDGNGRVARLLATLVFVRAGWLPLVVERDHRAEYLEALEKADDGSLRGLVAMFDRLQRVGFMKALSVAAQVQQEQDELPVVLDSIRARLATRGARPPNGLDHLTIELRDDAVRLVTEVRDELAEIIGVGGATGNVVVDVEDVNSAFWYRRERIELAQEFDYFADFAHYSHWVRLKINLADRFDVLVSFTGVGRNTSAMAVVVGAWDVSRGDGASVRSRSVHVVSQEPFTATGREDHETARGRFASWLRTDLARGLAVWQRGL